MLNLIGDKRLEGITGGGQITLVTPGITKNIMIPADLSLVIDPFHGM